MRERYGVEPAQVPDFIALRGDPSDQIPGARGVGAEDAPRTCCAQYGSLEALLEAGRFAAEADALRLYRQIATLDASAPLPPVEDARAGLGGARPRSRDEWALERLAGRLEAAASRS